MSQVFYDYLNIDSVIRIKPLIDQYFEVMLQFYAIKSNVNRSLDKT